MREQMKRYGGTSTLQYTTHLDEGETIRIKPDFVWSSTATPRIVVDAKYKAEKPRGYPNADLYQLLAYCTVLGLRAGHLIYARGNEEPTRHVVRGAGVEVVCHALDLGQPPDALLAEVRRLAAAICGTWATRRPAEQVT